MGLLAQVDRAGADLSQAEVDKDLAMGGEEWVATVRYSETTTLKEDVSTSFSQAGVHMTDEQHKTDVTRMSADVSADAITFNHVKKGAHKGDFNWDYGAQAPGVGSRGSGTSSHDVKAVTDTTGQQQGMSGSSHGTENTSSTGKLTLSEMHVAFSLSPERHAWGMSAEFSYPEKGTQKISHKSSGQMGGATGGGADPDQVNDIDTTANGGFTLGPDTKGATMTARGKGYVIDYTLTDSKTENRPRPPLWGGNSTLATTHQVTIHVDVMPKVVSKYVATLVPVEPATYPTWLPVGPELPGQAWQAGQDIAFRVEVHSKKDGKLVTDRRELHYALTSSNSPGIAMNFPPAGKPDLSPDLTLTVGKNLGGVGGGQALYYPAKVDVAKQIATVTSNDYGAYGSLSATVTINGEVVAATYTTDEKKELEDIPVPKDDNENHLADAWEHHPDMGRAPESGREEEDIYAKNLPATWDEDAQPTQGSPPNPTGDGIALYEEYRGFYASEDGTISKHVRLSPRWKDFFVYLPKACSPLDVPFGCLDTPAAMRPQFVAGALIFDKFSRIKTHFMLDKEQIQDVRAGAHHHPRINFNAAEGGDFGRPQYAVLLAVADIKVTPEYTKFKCQPTFKDADGTVHGDADQGAFPNWRMQSTYDLKTPDMNTPADGLLPPETPEDTWAIVIRPSMVTGWMEERLQILGFGDRGCCPDPKGKRGADGKLHSGCWMLFPQFDWLARHKTTAAAFVTEARKHLDVLAARMTSFAIMHELRHAMGAFHHSPQNTSGATSCPMRYWALDDEFFMSFLSMIWDPTQGYWSPYGKGSTRPWRFDDAPEQGTGPGVPKLHK